MLVAALFRDALRRITVAGRSRRCCIFVGVLTPGRSASSTI
jgi:hypothetical protein